MTVTEVSNQFDIVYDNVKSKSAPALDDYEKSVFLTGAMYEMLDVAISPLFKEGDSKTREIKKKLITSYETSNTIAESTTRKKLASNAVFYPRAVDIYKIDLEQVKLSSQDPFLNGHTAQVIPIAYDVFHRVLRNPYLGAQRDRVLRVDSGLEGVTSIVQLIPPANATIESYLIQYIKKPYPIILSDFDITFPGEKLSVYGQTTPYSSTEATDVSEIVQDEIIERAAKLAKAAYEGATLSNNSQQQ